MLTASLADAKQYAPIAAGMLSRHKAHPCSQMPAVLEVCSITNSGNDCGRRLWADATYLRDPLANVALAEDGVDLLVKVSDLFVELQKEGMKSANDIACQLGDIDYWIVDDLRYRALGDRRRLRNCHTAFEKQTSHLRDQGDTMIDQSLPSTVEALNVIWIIDFFGTKRICGC